MGEGDFIARQSCRRGEEEEISCCSQTKAISGTRVDRFWYLVGDSNL